MPLSTLELERYRRQLSIDRWDQERLKSARVLVVGAGGLGGISATYLAAAGVGHIRICDNDRIEPSNLNRQFLFTAGDFGKSKATLAAERLSAQNPLVRIEAITDKLTDTNTHRLASDCDLIIDGLDNHSDRLIMNKSAVELKRPFIYGAINEWQGQLSFFNPPITACLECLIPEQRHNPEPTQVFGALPGVIGSLQATLALRYLMTGENPIANTLLVFNASAMSFEAVAFEKRPECAVCGRAMPRNCRD